MSDLGNVKKMFGQELNISVTNADANVIASTPRLVPNTIIISSPQNANEKKDIIENNIHQASLFATDYNGVPVQITHVVKVGNGLYMDESRAIALGIDNHTLVTDSSSNRLCVQTTELEKASSVSLGVVKTANTCQRSESSFPKLANMTGISVNANGELFITDQLLQLIYNYINDSINTAIAPLLEVKSDIRLIDNYGLYYYPSTISTVSIQLVGLALNEENNEIGIFNEIQFTSTQENPLIVNFIIGDDGEYCIKQKTIEVISNASDSIIKAGVLMYNHKAENIFFSFYPNLTTHDIDYQIICNIRNNEGEIIVEDTMFKFSQQFISSNKNELFTVTSIVIDDDTENSSKTKITSIQYNINSIIRNYILNDVIASLTLKLSYKINNAVIDIPLEITKDNINTSILSGENLNLVNNLSGLSNNTEVSWSITANFNMNIGTDNNDTYEFNNGLINVYKNTYHVTYILYYVLNDTTIALNNETTQSRINYEQNNNIVDDDSQRHYILQLQFSNSQEYNLIYNDREVLNIELYMDNEDGENYYILSDDGTWPNQDDYVYYRIIPEISLGDGTSGLEWDNINYTLSIHIYDYLLHKFKFKMYKNINAPILQSAFISNLNTALYNSISVSSRRYSNMKIKYNTFKTNDSNEYIIRINEQLFNNLIIADRTDLSNHYTPFIENAGEDESYITINNVLNNVNLIIDNPTNLQYYYYFYDGEAGIYCITPLYNNTSGNGINLYDQSKVSLNEHQIKYKTSTEIQIINESSIGTIYTIPANHATIQNKLNIPAIINAAFNVVESNGVPNININTYLLLNKYNEHIDDLIQHIMIYESSDDSNNYFIRFDNINALMPNNFIIENNQVDASNIKMFMFSKTDNNYINS